MSSGWGCAYLGKKDQHKEWCLRLKHPCKPGCSGCIITGAVTYSEPQIDSWQKKKVKKRSDNPLK